MRERAIKNCESVKTTSKLSRALLRTAVRPEIELVHHVFERNQFAYINAAFVWYVFIGRIEIHNHDGSAGMVAARNVSVAMRFKIETAHEMH
jgi:hypothetical protein